MTATDHLDSVQFLTSQAEYLFGLVVKETPASERKMRSWLKSKSQLYIRSLVTSLESSAVGELKADKEEGNKPEKCREEQRKDKWKGNGKVTLKQNSVGTNRVVEKRFGWTGTEPVSSKYSLSLQHLTYREIHHFVSQGLIAVHLLSQKYSNKPKRKKKTPLPP